MTDAMTEAMAAWSPGQPVSWSRGPGRWLVPATVVRDDGGPEVVLSVMRADGMSVCKRVAREQVVGIGQGDLFGDPLLARVSTRRTAPVMS